MSSATSGRWRSRRLRDALRGRGPIRLRARLATVAAMIVVAIALWHAAASGSRGAPAATAQTPRELADAAAALHDGVIDAWGSRVQDDGRIADPVLGARGDYGTAMLLDGILRRAVEQRDQGRAVRALRGLAAQAEDPSLGAFELLAYSEIARWAAARLPSDPALTGAWYRARGPIAGYLATRTSLTDNPRVRSCYAAPACLGNQKIVGAVALAALLRTELPSSSGQALLGAPSARYRELSAVLRLVARRAGDDVRRTGVVDLAPGGVLSDPPRNPTAYFALSVAMLGHLIGTLEDSGLEVPGPVRDGFGRAARGLLALAAPDGDLAYLGRGQGQVWVPAITAAAGAQIAAHAQDALLTGPALAIARASLVRLEREYVRPGGMLSLLPGAGTDEPVPAGRSVDHYAALRTYNGLAAWALHDAATVLRGLDGRATAVPAASDGVTVAPRSGGAVTITRGGRWVALVTRRQSPGDTRYGPGLISMRAKRADRWRAVVPERPLLTGSLPTIALGAERGELRPGGEARPVGASSVLVSGTWEGAGARLAMRQRWWLDGAGALHARWVMPTGAPVVVRALAPAQARVRPVLGGVEIGDGTRAVRWVVRIDGRLADTSRSRGASGGSAYAAGVEVHRLRAAALAGQRVELIVRPRS